MRRDSDDDGDVVGTTRRCWDPLFRATDDDDDGDDDDDVVGGTTTTATLLGNFFLAAVQLASKYLQ